MSTTITSRSLNFVKNFKISKIPNSVQRCEYIIVTFISKAASMLEFNFCVSCNKWLSIFVNVQTKIPSPDFTLHRPQYNNPVIILCELLITVLNAALSVPQFITSFLKLRYLISCRKRRNILCNNHINVMIQNRGIRIQLPTKYFNRVFKSWSFEKRRLWRNKSFFWVDKRIYLTLAF